MGSRRDSSDDGVKTDKYQVPLFAEVKDGAAKFGPAHQYVIQYLLKYGQVSQKRFYIAYINYFATMILDKDESVVSNINASLAQLMELTSTIVETCNEKAHKIGIQLAASKRESDGQNVVSVITQKGFSQTMANRYGVSLDERVFLSRMISEFAQSNGELSSDRISDIAREIPNLTLLKRDKILDKLVENHWISEKDDVYHLEPRAASELDPLLRAKYQTPTCVFCQTLIIDRSNVGACEGCHIYAHDFCVEKMSKDGAAVDCPLTCGNKLELTGQLGGHLSPSGQPAEEDEESGSEGEGRPGTSTRTRPSTNTVDEAVKKEEVD